MNILDKLNDKFENFCFKDLGINDLFTSMQLRHVLDKYADIDKYFSSYEKNAGIDLLCDYFFLKTFENMGEYIQNIKPEFKERFKKFVDSIPQWLDKFNQKEISAAIKDNFNYLFDSKNPWLKETLFLYIWNNNEFNNLFSLIINNDFCVQFIITNLPKNKQFENKFRSHLNWCQQIFNFDKLSKYLNNGIIINDWLLNFISRFKDHDNELIQNEYKKFETFLKNKLDEYSKKIKNIDNEWIGNRMICDNILNFFIRNKYPDQDKYNSIKKDIFDFENKYLEKYGHKVEYKPSAEHQNELNKFLQDWYANIETYWNIKLLELTHKKDENNNIFTFYEEIGKNNKKELIDNFGPCTDDYFFSSKIQRLNIHNHFFFKILWNYYLLAKSDIFFDKILSLIKHSYKLIYKTDDIFNGEKVEYDILIGLISSGIRQIIKIIKDKQNINDNEKIEVQTHSYYVLTSLISLIEKILRLFYLSELIEDDKYLENIYPALGNFLNPTSPLNKILGENTAKIIKYFLCNRDVGPNIRNKLMHYNFNQNMINTLNINNIMLCIYILLIILNAWCLFKSQK